MTFSKGNSSITYNDIINKISEAAILSYYLGIDKIPTIINSPLRRDRRPSFGLYSPDGVKIKYIDFSTKDKGGIFDLLGNMWGYSYHEVLDKINKDIGKFKCNNINISKHIYSDNIKDINTHNKNTILQCKIRKWKKHDIEYWSSYGISLEWLKYAEVYPISHKIIIKDNKRYVFSADKYAYAYVEHKEDKVTIKIYQPFNTKGYKWSNKHDSSVISLWTKVPQYGKQICICSSLKDALCLSANYYIPTIAVQGEGYKISNTAINELKRRYKYIYICFDNDEPGINDGKILSQETGFINIILPQFEGGKDISDMYKVLGKDKWLKIIESLFSLQE